MPYGYGSANKRGPSGPGPGGQGARGQATQNPGRAPRATSVTTGGPPSVLNPPPKRKIITGGGGPPIVLNPPTPSTPPVTTRGQSPFPYTRRVGITSNYMNPTFRKATIDRARKYQLDQLANRPKNRLETWQNMFGGDVTQIGYVPKYAKPSGMYSTSIAQGLYKKAIEEGVGPKEFETWLKGEGSDYKEGDPEYADILSKELQISDWDKIYPSKDLDVKGRNTEKKQREALNTLMGELQTKKEALKGTDKEMYLDPKDEFEKDMLNRELTVDYEKNKDRLNDLGITSKEEYEDLVNKSISLARGGIVNLFKYGGFLG